MGKRSIFGRCSLTTIGTTDHQGRNKASGGTSCGRESQRSSQPHGLTLAASAPTRRHLVFRRYWRSTISTVPLLASTQPQPKFFRLPHPLGALEPVRQNRTRTIPIDLRSHGASQQLLDKGLSCRTRGPQRLPLAWKESHPKREHPVLSIAILILASSPLTTFIYI